MKVPKSSRFEISIIVHNLMINPNDLPNQNENVLNEKGEEVYHCGNEWYICSDYYEDEQCRCTTPLLWYNIPQFDTNRTELEKLSKEELIELILKERGNK